MTRTLRLLFLGLAAFALASLLMGCPNTKLANTLSSSVNFTDKDFELLRIPKKKNSVNVTVSNPVSSERIQQLFHALFPLILPLDSIKVRSCPCDKTLLNITLPDNWIIEGQGGNLAVKTPDGAQEGDVAIPGMTLAGLNYPVSPFDDSPTNQQENPAPAMEQKLLYNVSLGNKIDGRSIRIAIFDSGLNPDYIPLALAGGPTYLCEKGTATAAINAGSSTSGWNFVANNTLPINTNTLDAGSVHHGSRVANLLAKQFNGSSVTPHIVPMRVLDADHKGDLFGLMCAMETARLNGIKVFNMSLGYYGPEDKLLKSYFTRAVNDNVWIVVAAGNCQQYEPPTINRDLATATMNPKFYPAAFRLSTGFDKLLVVTTVLTPGATVQASIGQNYSQAIALGVRADAEPNPGEGRFLLATTAETRNGAALFVFGSSYATPILAGRLARFLAESTSPVTSSASLLTLMDQGNSGSQILDNRYFTSSP